MFENSTLNDLILYYFNETGMTDAVLTQKAIDTDTETEEEYNTIVATMDYIDKSMVNPSDQSVKNILDYSKSLQKANS